MSIRLSYQLKLDVLDMTVRDNFRKLFFEQADSSGREEFCKSFLADEFFLVVPQTSPIPFDLWRRGPVESRE